MRTVFCRLCFAFILIALSIGVSADEPYFLENGPVKGAGLPFLDNDLSLYFAGTYVRRDTGFKVRTYYTADKQDLSVLRKTDPPACSPKSAYSAFFAAAGSAPGETVVTFTDFESKGWDPYFRPEEDPAPLEPKKAVLYFIVVSGNSDELCSFIPLFEERLRYYMNARKQDVLLPLPAVLVKNK